MFIDVTSISATAQFAIELTLKPEFYENKAIIDADELLHLGQISQVVESIKEVLGPSIGSPYLDWPYLRLIFNVTEDPFAYAPDAIIADINFTAKELKDNAALPVPLPLKKAASNYDFVNILYSIFTCTATVWYQTNRGSQMLPILNESDFIDPGKPNINIRMGPFKITGIFRSWDPSIGHGLFVGRERNFVRLPPNDPKWDWDSIRHALDVENWLTLGVDRDKKGGEWRPLNHATICAQSKLNLNCP